MSTYLCIDIGGTSVKYGIYREEEGFLEVRSLDTLAHLGAPSVLERTMEAAQALLSKYPGALGICISTAGMVDCEEGRIVYASPLIPDYTGSPVRSLFEARFGLPCEVENDVNCAGLAEYHSGAARGASSCLCLTVGTGIGGAFLQEGKVLHGFCGSGCEVGYLPLPGGAFQDLASASSLVKRAAAYKGLPAGALSGKEVFSMAIDWQDPDCIRAIDEMAACLGMGIAGLCYTLNPQIVVLGGGIMVQKDYLYGKIRAAIDDCLLPFIARNTALEFAHNQNRAGMLGAYYHFRTRRKD